MPRRVPLIGFLALMLLVPGVLVAATHSNFAVITILDRSSVGLGGRTGVNLILMSDACDGFALSARTFRFSDAAAGALGAGPCSNGIYKPTNINAGTDTFPAPAPAPSANTTLSAFDGLNPNGTWSLYVVDDANVDSGRSAAAGR